MLLLRRGVWLLPDSASYLNDAPIIAPLYPFFLRLHRWVFGDAFLKVVVFSQLAFGFGGCLCFANVIRRSFSLPRSLAHLLTAILLLPYLTNLHFGNGIMTEGLAYPLFLLVMKYVWEGLAAEKSSALAKSFLWGTLLVLTRKQFIGLYPLFAMIIAYVYFFRGSRYRKHVLLSVFLITVVAAQLIERSYQYARDGHFRSVPFTGVLTLTAALFVSHEEDAELFSNDMDRQFFEKVHGQMVEKGLARGSAIAGNENLVVSLIDHFHASYNAICWRTVLPILREYGIRDWYGIDSMTRRISWILTKANLREYLKLYRINVVSGAGGNGQAIFLVLFLLLAMGFHVVNRSKLSLVAAAMSLFSLMNLLLVAIAEPVMLRYVAYTEYLQVCVYLVVVFKSFERIRQGKPALQDGEVV